VSDDIIEDWHGKATSSGDTRKQAVIDARRRVHAAMFLMPYGAGVHYRHSQDYIETVTELTFLGDLADYLKALGETLLMVSESTSIMSDELNELRAQRHAVRNFLGLNERNTA